MPPNPNVRSNLVAYLPKEFYNDSASAMALMLTVTREEVL